MANWWKEEVVYQIYPKSFQDSNGDGVGDIPGIISRLDYLKDLGVGVIWLSPVYRSPNVDNGYDISDYRDINPEYGTMADMLSLIAEAKKRGIKIVMDLVINHTSSEHEWFQKSRDKDSPFRDYYIWREGRDGKLPNNWTSFFAEDCWEYDERSGEYYLHLFAKEQPDLNYRNPKVLQEVKEILKFWLDRGVAGFRCDVINIIFKESLADGKKRIAVTGLEHYLSREGTHEILRTLRKDVLSNYDCFTVGETVFVTTKTANDLCGSSRGELDMVFAFEHMEVDQYFVKWFPRKFKPKRFFKTLDKWQRALEWNANYFENHDQPRSVSRFGNTGEFKLRSAKALAILLLTLRGTPYVFQGQEIGMENYPFKGLDDIADVESHNFYKLATKLHIPKWYKQKMLMRGCRDHARTPMQWNNSANAGFTTGTPWLAVNPNFTAVNTESQIGKPDSVYEFYKKMIACRRENPALLRGDYTPVVAGNLFAYKRIVTDCENGKRQTALVVINLSTKKHTFRFPDFAKSHCRILISNTDRQDLPANGLTLEPYEGIVIEVM